MTDDHNRLNCDIGGCDICMSYGDLMRLVADENRAKRQAEAAAELERLRVELAVSNDIAQRLRNWEAGACGRPDLYDEAADEIERLRDEIERLRRAATLNAPSDYMLRGEATA